MKYDYVKSKISDAIFELCTGQEDVRHRLLSAAEATISLTHNNFPPDLLPLWIKIHAMLTKYGPETDAEGKILEGAIKNTLRKIRNSSGTKIAKNLYQLNIELQSKY